MPTRLDLNHYHWRRDLREFTLYGTWLIDDEQDRPCMVIIRRQEQTHDHTVPCIVPMDLAYAFDPIGGDPQMAARACLDFAQALRMDPNNPKTVLRIHALIDDHLGDLLSIPPYSRPDTDAEATAEITVTDKRTGKTSEVVKDVI